MDSAELRSGSLFNRPHSFPSSGHLDHCFITEWKSISHLVYAWYFKSAKHAIQAYLGQGHPLVAPRIPRASFLRQALLFTRFQILERKRAYLRTQRNNKHARCVRAAVPASFPPGTAGYSRVRAAQEAVRSSQDGRPCRPTLDEYALQAARASLLRRSRYHILRYSDGRYGAPSKIFCC